MTGKKSPRTLLTSPTNRYRWSDADGGLVPAEILEGNSRSRLTILSDITDEAIVSPIDGSRHRSKKGYARHVHAHGKTIVGNEGLKAVEANRPRLESVGVTMARICNRFGIRG